MKPYLLIVLGLTVALAVSSCQRNAPLSRGEPPAVDAVAIDEETNVGDLADLLGARVWKFDVRLSNVKLKHLVRYEAVYFRTGHPPKQIAETNYYISGANPASSGKPERVMLALYPPDGSLFASKKLKIVLRAGTQMNSVMTDNPFRGSNIGISNLPSRLKDGSFLVMGVSPDSGLHEGPPIPNFNTDYVIVRFSAGPWPSGKRQP